MLICSTLAFPLDAEQESDPLMKLIPLLTAALLSLIAAPALADSASGWSLSRSAVATRVIGLPGATAPRESGMNEAPQAQPAVPAPPRVNTIALDLADLDMEQDHAQCRVKAPAGAHRHFIGLTDMHQVLALANEAETVTDGGKTTDTLSSAALKGLRRGTTRLLNGNVENIDTDVVLLAPHEAVTLCEISMRVTGKNIVSFR